MCDTIRMSGGSEVETIHKDKTLLSKCCNATITIGDFASECDECGNSVNPDTGEPYSTKTSQFGGIN